MSSLSERTAARYQELIDELDREISAYRMVHRSQPLFMNLYVADQIRKIVEQQSPDLSVSEVRSAIKMSIDKYERHWGKGVEYAPNIQLLVNLSYFL